MEVSRAMQNQSTTTRRRALQIGSLSALGAGLMAVVAPTASAATQTEPGPASDLLAALTASFQNDETWSEWIDNWYAEYAQIKAKHAAIIAQLEVYVPAEKRYELVGNLCDNAGDWAHHEADRVHELVIRHMPGLEPVLRLLTEHAMDTYLHAERECGQGNCSDGWGWG